MACFLFRNPAMGLAIAIIVLFAPVVQAQITLGQVDNFETNTLQNWQQGFSSPLGALIVTTGGPAGPTDRVMQITSTGGIGAGSRLIAFNTAQWIGDYTTAGVNAIEMDLRSAATNTASVQMRIGLRTSGSGYVTTVPFDLPNDGNWHHVTFSVTESAMTAVGAPSPFNTFISTPQGELRLFSASTINFNGDAIAAVVSVDNIRASFIPIPEPLGGLTAAVMWGWWRYGRKRFQIAW